MARLKQAKGPKDKEKEEGEEEEEEEEEAYKVTTLFGQRPR